MPAQIHGYTDYTRKEASETIGRYEQCCTLSSLQCVQTLAAFALVNMPTKSKRGVCCHHATVSNQAKVDG
jgi:hypothetical protein